jgi:hypothetical protein
MPTLAVVPCILCNRPAELPSWRRVAFDQTDAAEIFVFDAPFCLDCEERTRPTDHQGQRLDAEGGGA